MNIISFHRLGRRLRHLFFRRQAETEMAEELRFHLEMRTEDQIGEGIAPEEAEYASRRRFGNVARIQERGRAEWSLGCLEEAWNDLRFAVRRLAKTPGFTSIAVLIAALGIGAATAMFSTVNAVILRPIALPESSRLVALYETNLSRHLPLFSVSVANYMDWKARAQSWESLAALNWHAMNLTGEGESELIEVKEVTANFLPTLGIPVMLGRNFLPSEDKPGGARVAILSESFWQRHFGGVRDVIGRTLLFDNTPYIIVGVTAPGRPLASDLEVMVPLAADAALTDRRSNHDLMVYGRLKSGIAIERADAELKAIATQIWADFPEEDRGWSTRLVPFAREIVGDGIRSSLYVLLGSVGLLLLIVCANLSNLLLVRASARAHELAIRTALGASRWRIVRQMVTESFLVILLGGFLGVLISIGAVRLMQTLPLPRASEISVDHHGLGIAMGITLVAGLLAALGPALKASQVSPQTALKSRGPRAGHRSALRDAMVVTQIAISLTLLVGATLLGKSFLRLLQVKPGFNPENAITISLRPQDNDHAAQFYERLTERLAALPGVKKVGLISSLPLTEGNTSNTIYPVGPTILLTGGSIQSSWRLVDGGYFGAMQIPILRGRTFAGLSPEEASRSVVLSAALAKAIFGETDPVGRQIANLRPDGNRLDVIGVVGDVRSEKLGLEPGPTFYWSMHRFVYGPMHVIVRGDREISTLLPSIRAAVKQIDPNVPVFRARTLEQLRATSLEQESLMLNLLSGFTVTALLLAALGIYGVIAFTVQQRTHEIGIRIALGAQSNDILRLVVGQALRILAFGSLLGFVGALLSSRFIATMLYQTGFGDPATLLTATIALSLVTVLACWLPARRAQSVDPIGALRAE